MVMKQTVNKMWHIWSCG